MLRWVEITVVHHHSFWDNHCGHYCQCQWQPAYTRTQASGGWWLVAPSRMEGLISKQTELLQQVLNRLEERDAQRDVRDAQRDARDAQRDAREVERDAREVGRDARAAQRDEEMRAALTSLTLELQTRSPPLARALVGGSAAGGGAASPSPLASSSRGSGASSPRSSQRQQQSSLHDAMQTRLRDAFLAAQSAGSAFDLGSLVVPFPAQALLPRAVRFAHRITKGLIGETRDFGSVQEDITTLLLPPAESGKAGMSFFILLSDAPEVLVAAHAYHGVGASGCLAYPLETLPPGLALVVDKVQVVGAGAAAAPIMLHASLSVLERTPLAAIFNAVDAWGGKQVCLPAAGGGAGVGDGAQHGAPGACLAGCCGHGEGATGELGAPPEGAGGGDDATAALLKGAARALAAGLSSPPRGGAPGVS